MKYISLNFHILILKLNELESIEFFMEDIKREIVLYL